MKNIKKKLNCVSDEKLTHVLRRKSRKYPKLYYLVYDKLINELGDESHRALRSQLYNELKDETYKLSDN